jgi:hypothetical protein
MTPTEMLEVAVELVDRPPASARRCWQRASASLTRIALEKHLAEYWTAVSPSVVNCPWRHQLLALPLYAGVDVARVARAAWHGLSRAVHHHTYELPPTVAELTGWHHDVATLISALDPAGVTPSHRNGHSPR